MSDTEETEDVIEEIEVPQAQPVPPTEPQELSFQGIKVQFPYKPYESQKQMMEKMIKGMIDGQHCLLESPTGTGKTAALLCASLGWQNAEIQRQSSEDVPLVIYASRTHSQLKQIVDQLKKTAYDNTPMVILASRTQTCLNSTARGSSSIDEACEAMRKNYEKENASEYPTGTGNYPKCGFFSTYKKKGDGLDKQFSKRSNGTDSPWDLEDLKKFSSECETCPYYQIKIRKSRAKLVLCNYNHLIHPWIREAVGINIENNVIIFDEAHNIESICMDVASRKILLSKITNTILPALADASSKPNIPAKKIAPLTRLHVAFNSLRNWMNSFLSAAEGVFEKVGNLMVHPVNDAKETFTSIGLSPEASRDLYRDYCILEDKNLPPGEFDELAAEFKVNSVAMKAVSSILFTFSHLFWQFNGEFKNLKHYSVDVVKQTKNEVEVLINCNNPAVLFDSMKAARTVVVTSGTLSPIGSFCSELGVKFDHILSADHIIGRDRVFAASIRAHPDPDTENPCTLKFNHRHLYQEDNFDEVTKSLGDFLVQICKIIKEGILVFFPSKILISKMKSEWETDGTLQKISSFKQVFFEHEIGPTDFTGEIEKYRETANKGGAIMFAVLRGRVSEGVDFADDHARAVVTIGIPFLPIYDLKVKRKREYNDRIRSSQANEGLPANVEQLLTGYEWYRTVAFRALNQAFGRCVRHAKDWGIVFLVEQRHRLHWNYHSKWVHDSNRHVHGTILNKELLDELNQFLNSVAPNAYDVPDESPNKMARLET